MNNRYKELFANTLLFTVANLGSKVLVFLMVPLYTTILSPSEFGVVDLISTTISLLLPLFTICIVDAVLRFCFIKEIDNRKVFSIGIYVILIGSGAISLLALLLRQLNFFQDLSEFVYFMPLTFFTTSTSRLLTNFARGIDKVKYSAINGVVQTIAIIIFNLLFLLFLGWGVFGYLLSVVISDVISITYLSICYKPWNYLTTNFSRNLVVRMFSFSIPLIPNSLSWWMLSSLNRYFLKFYMGISAVGIFSATMRIPTILIVLSNIFAEAWLLSAIKDYGSVESRNFIIKVHQCYFTLLVLVTAFIILLSKPLAIFLLADEYARYWYLIPFLFVSVFFGALSGFIGSLYSAEQKTSLYFISTLIGGSISIIITIFFLKSTGIELISFSMMVGYFCVWLIRRLTILKYVNIGVGLLQTGISCILLVSVAVFVMKEYFYWGCICFTILFVMQMKQLRPFIDLVKTLICNRFK